MSKNGWAPSNFCCPKCHAPLVFEKVTGDCGLATCSCSCYPFVNGILYLVDDSLRKRAVTLLKKRKPWAGIWALSGLPHRYAVLFWLTFFSGKVNKLIRKIIGRDIGQILGFKIVVEIMAALGYPRAWVEYIKNREEMTMFFISLASVNSISEEKRGMILDVGCGPGQILSALSRKKNLREIVGIDRSFVSLLLARKFFASPQDLLICADVEAGLPLIDGSINTIFCTDTFHYFRKKTSFLKESFRVLKSTGVLYLQHIVNSNSLKFGNIRGTTPRRLKEMLGKTGFKVSHFYPNSLLWQNLKDHNFLDLKTRDLFAKAEESFAFSCYVSKDVLSARLRLNPQERRLVVRKKFNLAIDRELWKEVKVLQSRPNDQSD